MESVKCGIKIEHWAWKVLLLKVLRHEKENPAHVFKLLSTFHTFVLSTFPPRKEYILFYFSVLERTPDRKPFTQNNSCKDKALYSGHWRVNTVWLCYLNMHTAARGHKYPPTKWALKWFLLSVNRFLPHWSSVLFSYLNVTFSNAFGLSSPQVFFTPAESSTDKPLLPDTSTANNTDYETAISLSEPETAVPCLPLQEQSLEERKEREEERKEATEVVSVEQRKELVEKRKAGYHTETTSESEAGVVRSEGCHSNPEQSERRARNTLSVQERGSFCGCHEPRSSHLRKPHAGTKLMQTPTAKSQTDIQRRTHFFTLLKGCTLVLNGRYKLRLIPHNRDTQTHTWFLYVFDILLWWALHENGWLGMLS